MLHSLPCLICDRPAGNLIEIHWNLMENQFSHFLSSLVGQFESFKTFLTGAIPASGLTITGFAVGLRRK
jgi:hypothetical protein